MTSPISQLSIAQRVGEYVYDKKNLLGKGTFADVYLGWHKQQKETEVAIKVINLRTAPARTLPSELLFREITILEKLASTPHRNIVTLLYSEKNKDVIYLVLEYCRGGDLRDYLKEKTTLRESVIRQFFLQIGVGIEFLHSKGIIHRDLKPDNILLVFDGQRYPAPRNIVLKIGDFGLGRCIPTDFSEMTVCGTPRYMAPEINTENYGKGVDLWSIGVMMYECLVGTQQASKDLKKRVLPPNTSQHFKDVLEKLLVEQPERRLDIDQFLTDKFIQNRICLKPVPSLVNQEKKPTEANVVMASTMVTRPVCLSVVPFYDSILSGVPTAQRKCLHELGAVVGKTKALCQWLLSAFVKLEHNVAGEVLAIVGKTKALCQWLLLAFDKYYLEQIHYVAGEALEIMRSNVDLTRHIYWAIWTWICSVFRSSRRRRLTDYDPLLPDHTPRGLQNLGNTCYFNSVMQSLCNTHVFSSELQNNNQNEKLTLSFRDLADKMGKKGTLAFAPTKVRSDFVNSVSRFNNHGQHDSHECLRHFLDEIRKEQRKTLTGSPGNGLLTAVDKIFGGHLVTVYICKECDKHYHLFEPCLDVSLPVFFETETKPVASESHTSSEEKLIEIDKDEANEQNTACCDGSKSSGMEIINQGEQRHEGSKVHKRDDQDSNYKRSVQKLTKRLLDSQSSDHLTKDDSTDSTTHTIQLDLSSSSKTAISLDDCLKHFSRVEQINKEYLCEDCLREAMARGEADEDNLKLTSATKQTLIFNPPAILTIHFKRFELLPGRSRKRSDMVEYPEYLDIAPYCSSQCLRNDPPRNNIWYSLYAVVVHSGSLEFGHYVAYVKMREGDENARSLDTFLQQKYFNHNVTSDELIQMMKKEKQEISEGSKQPKREEDSKWYLMNDSSVYEVHVDDALNQEAYLLFYERVDLTEKQPHCYGDTV